GFAVGQAAAHPFYNTRLVGSYEQTARQENWIFQFKWNEKPFSFSSYPPGYLGSLSVGDGASSQAVSTRTLSGTLQTVVLGANRLKLEPRIIFPSEVSRFLLTIKSADAGETLLS